MLFLIAYTLLLTQIVPPQVPEWIPHAAISLAGTIFLTLMGALYRSEQRRKHLELMRLLARRDDAILETCDTRYVRKKGVEEHHRRPAHEGA
jgi:hypothetical protein